MDPLVTPLVSLSVFDQFPLIPIPNIYFKGHEHIPVLILCEYTNAISSVYILLAISLYRKSNLDQHYKHLVNFQHAML